MPRMPIRSSAWGSRFFVTDADPLELVGWGGFKGPPNDGVVELGYEIAEPRQGRGLATAATRAMVEEAAADEGVRIVIARTLAEPNASNTCSKRPASAAMGRRRRTARPCGATRSRVRQDLGDA